MSIRFAIAVVVVASCGAKPPPPPPPPHNEVVEHAPPDAAPPIDLDLDSKDVLARTDEAPEAYVKHILFGWRELESNYHGHLDERAKDRTQEEAARLAKIVADRLRRDPTELDALIKQYSEDPGSHEVYPVKHDAPFVPEFKALALRLHENEVGLVKTMFGYHVILRLPPPPLDPLESADILARTPEAGPVLVQHVLVAWKGRSSSQATRSKAEADQLAKEVFDKAVAGGDMAALMAKYSEDPGSKDNARTYEVKADSPMVDDFKKLVLRLHMGEVGLVISPFGWHVVKRVPPPPPDSLESTAVMNREPVTDHAKVKHILLGWTEVHADDPRGKKRDRRTLEKLVKATVAKLQKGAKIEPLMKELSEDPGSATTGTSYEVTPDAALVPPFLRLSLRLKVNEIGVVKTEFGIHIIQRVE
jgi:parvulin-like peptidyl-prolyl isomerase